ncbi:IPT/TIG domain-containing protein [Burkholderia arboris]|uniref:IPT/TIG domain-containing protein n=1 Tax=Burkholderia arboris TaxID=488730 RepID=UPI0015820A44|nr:IPT/TIG domain-containing protein [Burkholderia arboris]
MRTIHIVWIGVVLVWIGFSGVSIADPINYSYDELGRLVSVVDGSGEAAVYEYDAAGNILSIVRKSGPISVLSVTPRQAPVNSIVTVSGYGFSSAANENSVTFDGVAATVVSASQTQLLVRVPSGAASGLVTVSAPAGTAASLKTFSVSVDVTPTLTSVSPTVAAPGDAISILGSNFQATNELNNLSLNLRSAFVQSSTGTTITSSVPMGATSGRVGVTTPFGRVDNGPDLFVPPSPYTVASVDSVGRMNLDGPGTVAVGAAGKIGLKVFDGHFGQRASVLMNSTTFTKCTLGSLRILSPLGEPIAQSNLCATSFTGSFSLPVDGSYTVLVLPESSDTGNVSLTAYDATDATGTISPGGSPVALSTTKPGQQISLTFAGIASKRISLLAGLDSSMSKACVYFSITSPDGSTLLPEKLSCGSTYFSGVQPLPSSGNYTIRLRPTVTNVGAVTFTLYDVPQDATAAISSDGTPVGLSVSTPGQRMNLTFNGITGQKISLVADIASPLWQNCEYFSITSPDGSLLLPQKLNCNTSFFSGVITLPSSGTYSILLAPASTTVGSATFKLYTVPPDTTGTIVANGTPIGIVVSAPGQKGSLTFSASTGDRISLNVSPDSSMAQACQGVAVTNPDGSTVTSTNVCFSGFFSGAITLAQTGTYKIQLTPSGTSMGTMTFSLYGVPPDVTGVISIGGSAVPVTLSTPGQSAVLSFNGQAAQTVKLSVNVSKTCNYVAIYKPDGTDLLSRTMFCSSNYTSSVLTLPITGTYQIKLTPSSTSVGSATFNLTNQ